jgi:hypothetical protein
MSNQHEENAMGGYEPEQEATHSLYDEEGHKVTEAELEALLDHFWKCDGFDNNTFDLNGAAHAILSHYTLVKKGV